MERFPVRRRNLGGDYIKPSNHCQTIYPPYPYTIYAPYLSNHCIQVWALYIQNHGLSSIFLLKNE